MVQVKSILFLACCCILRGIVRMQSLFPWSMFVKELGLFCSQVLLISKKIRSALKENLLHTTLLISKKIDPEEAQAAPDE